MLPLDAAFVNVSDIVKHSSGKSSSIGSSSCSEQLCAMLCLPPEGEGAERGWSLADGAGRRKTKYLREKVALFHSFVDSTFYLYLSLSIHF